MRQHNDEGEDHLLIAKLDGTNEHEIAMRKFPDHFSINAAPAWSPDNSAVAVVIQSADANGFFMKAVEGELIDRKKQEQGEAGDPDGKSEYIDRTKGFLFDDVPEGDFEKVGKHEVISYG